MIAKAFPLVASFVGLSLIFGGCASSAPDSTPPSISVPPQSGGTGGNSPCLLPSGAPIPGCTPGGSGPSGSTANDLGSAYCQNLCEEKGGFVDCTGFGIDYSSWLYCKNCDSLSVQQNKINTCSYLQYRTPDKQEICNVKAEPKCLVENSVVDLEIPCKCDSLTGGTLFPPPPTTTTTTTTPVPTTTSAAPTSTTPLPSSNDSLVAENATFANTTFPPSTSPIPSTSPLPTTTPRTTTIDPFFARDSFEDTTEPPQPREVLSTLPPSTSSPLLEFAGENGEGQGANLKDTAPFFDETKGEAPQNREGEEEEQASLRGTQSPAQTATSQAAGTGRPPASSQPSQASTTAQPSIFESLGINLPFDFAGFR